MLIVRLGVAGLRWGIQPCSELAFAFYRWFLIVLSPTCLFCGFGEVLAVQFPYLLEHPCNVKVLRKAHVVVRVIEYLHESVLENAAWWRARHIGGIANLHAPDIVNHGFSIVHDRHVPAVEVGVDDLAVDAEQDAQERTHCIALQLGLKVGDIHLLGSGHESEPLLPASYTFKFLSPHGVVLQLNPLEGGIVIHWIDSI